ncbi:hypothetical protein K438DRAFT_1978684 [Mycena galopus ATCC 62051]|nr:hypothetical protein K438DRAFT_1978684 [Mycena galopus ATCC 62051]
MLICNQFHLDMRLITAATFNTLIDLYNAKLAKPEKAPNVDNEEDTISEPDVPTLKAAPSGSLVPFESNNDVEVPQNPAARSPTKAFQKQVPLTSVKRVPAVYG